MTISPPVAGPVSPARQGSRRAGGTRCGPWCKILGQASIEGRGSDPKLLKISGDGAPEDYHYYKGVDKAGNFYGATWAEAYDWLPAITKYGYEDGIVQWTMPETHSGEIDDIYFDAQARLYTVGALMEPVGDAENYISRYAGGDTEAPAAVPDLAVTVVSSNSITLAWTAPGDDGITGTAAVYDLRYTIAGPILTDADFSSAIQVQGEPTPQAAGSAETFTITGLGSGATYFFALIAVDEAGNMGGLSNSPRGITLPVHKYSIRKSTGDWQMVTVSSWSAPLVGLVNIFGTTDPASGVKVDFSISTWPAGAQGQELSKSTENAVNGLADVLLKLGSIPAEYGVTATCSSCEPSASTATFTCCGKLPNDHFSQGDPAWSTHTYANSSNTIQARGCALSSLAMLNNYYGTTISTAIPDTNPGALNIYLRNNSGYDVEFNHSAW